MKLFHMVPEETESTSAAVATAEPIESAIAREAAAEELEVERSDVMADLEGYDAAIQTAGELEEAMAIESDFQEKGLVNAGVAQLIMANQDMLFARVGADSETVSRESIEETPEAVVALSHEAKGEMLKKIMDTVKKAWVKISGKIKKIVATAIMTVSDYEKQVEALVAKKEGLTSDLKEGQEEYAEEELTRILKRNALVGYNFLDGVTSSAFDPSDKNYVGGGFSGLSDVVSAIASYDAGKITGAIKGGALTTDSLATAFGVDGKVIGMFDGADKLEEELKDKEVGIAFLGSKGLGVKGVAYYAETAMLPGEAGEMTVVKTVPVALSANEAELVKAAKAKASVISSAGIDAILKTAAAVAKNSKGVKGLTDELVKATDALVAGKIDAEKLVTGTDLSDEAKATAIASAEKNYGSMANGLSSAAGRATVEALFGYINTIGTLKMIATTSMAHYVPAEAK